jgi:hypothetical protein
MDGRAGSWKPAFLWPVGVQFLAFWMWSSHASVTPARETFDASAAAAAIAARERAKEAGRQK